MFISVIKVTYTHYRQICVVSDSLLRSLGSLAFIVFFNGNVDLFFSFHSWNVKMGFKRKMSIKV